MIPFEMNGLFLLLLATIIALLAWALKRLISIDRTTAELNAWTVGHEKSDDKFQKRIDENLSRIWMKLDDK